MNRFVMNESGRDVAFRIVSARIAFEGSRDADPVCQVRVVASRPKLPEDAVLWFDALRGVRGPTFSLREDVLERGAGFHLGEDQALEDVKLDLRLDGQTWHLDVTCALLSMGWEPTRIAVSADLELCERLDPAGGD